MNGNRLSGASFLKALQNDCRIVFEKQETQCVMKWKEWGPTIRNEPFESCACSSPALFPQIVAPAWHWLIDWLIDFNFLFVYLSIDLLIPLSSSGTSLIMRQLFDLFPIRCRPSVNSGNASQIHITFTSNLYLLQRWICIFNFKCYTLDQFCYAQIYVCFD